MSNPIKELSVKEWVLWVSSAFVVVLSNIIPGNFDLLTLAATLVGVTSLVFAAKGNVWAQILMVVFSILYGIISFRFRYWGEMITYLGMTLPMAVWLIFTWVKNPSEENGNQVQIQKLSLKQVFLLALSTAAVTAVFYFILVALKTPNIVFSTISVTTSFVAASLTMMRSSYYAAGYAANDLVLIVLWVLASLKNPVYIPMVVKFAVFFLNDMYGFFSWKKREKLQNI